MIANVSVNPDSALETFLGWCVEQRDEVEALAFVDGWGL